MCLRICQKKRSELSALGFCYARSEFKKRLGIVHADNMANESSICRFNCTCSRSTANVDDPICRYDVCSIKYFSQYASPCGIQCEFATNPL